MNWIISCNTNAYDIFSAFKELEMLSWHKPRALSKSEIGDKVYIYCSKPYQKIMFKCEIIDFLSVDDMKDKKFWKVPYKESENKSFIKIKLLKEFDIEEMKLENLLENGLKQVPQWPLKYEGSDKIIKYIEKVLKSEEEKLKKFKNEEEIKNFWIELNNYLLNKENFSNFFKMLKPNQNWVNINFLPTKENKEAHIVLRAKEEKFIIEYYIDDNKEFYNYLKNKISDNEYLWESKLKVKSSRIYKENNLENFNSKEEVFKWYLKEILQMYNIFPYYLIEFKEKNINLQDEIEEELYTEGKRIVKVVNKFERNPLARKKCIEIQGVTCKICGMDFENKYGELGKDFIEVHHIKPMNEIGEEYIVNPTEDLIPVCSNCHSMLHRKINGKTVSVEVLKEIVNKNKK